MWMLLVDTLSAYTSCHVPKSNKYTLYVTHCDMAIMQYHCHLEQVLIHDPHSDVDTHI